MTRKISKKDAMSFKQLIKEQNSAKRSDTSLLDDSALSPADMAAMQNIGLTASNYDYFNAISPKQIEKEEISFGNNYGESESESESSSGNSNDSKSKSSGGSAKMVPSKAYKNELKRKSSQSAIRLFDNNGNLNNSGKQVKTAEMNYNNVLLEEVNKQIEQIRSGKKPFHKEGDYIETDKAKLELYAKPALEYKERLLKQGELQKEDYQKRAK